MLNKIDNKLVIKINDILVVTKTLEGMEMATRYSQTNIRLI